jgi:hypothetical protein
LHKYNPDKWAKLPSDLKGEIIHQKWEQGGEGDMAEDREKGRDMVVN